VEFVGDADNVTVYYINEGNLQGCPHVKIQIGSREIVVLIDSGAEVSVMSEDLLNFDGEWLKVPIYSGSKLCVVFRVAIKIKTNQKTSLD
jgi:hypothetical protein